MCDLRSTCKVQKCKIIHRHDQRLAILDTCACFLFIKKLQWSLFANGPYDISRTYSYCNGPKRCICTSTNHGTIRYHAHFYHSECLKWFSLLKWVYYSNTQISHFWYSVSKFLVIQLVYSSC